MMSPRTPVLPVLTSSPFSHPLSVADEFRRRATGTPQEKTQLRRERRRAFGEGCMMALTRQCFLLRARRALCTSGCVLSCATASLATAQTSSAPPLELGAAAAQAEPTGTAPDPQGTDIVVTARRVSESLQRTPVAVTAVTGDALTARGMTSVAAIEQIAPNVTFNPTASNSGSSNAAVVFIRGIGQSDFYPQVDPGVGIYLDGVYISRSTGAVLDATDVAQIEVLRGPQGTLYGKNTIGGAISITSKQPTNRLGGYVEVTGGRYSRIDARGRLDLPLSDKLLTSLSFATLNRDGYYRLVDFGTGRRVGSLGNISALTGRFAALYTPTSTLEFNFSADWTRRREESAGSTLLQINPDALAIVVNNTVPQAPTFGTVYDNRYLPKDKYTSYANPALSNSDLDVWGTALTGKWQAADWLTVKSISAYRSSKSSFLRDGDDSPALIQEFPTVIDQTQFSQEVQFLGDAFDKRLTFIAGLYYLHENVDAFVPANFSFVSTDNRAKIKNDAYAGFGQIGLKLATGLRATFGARYTIDRKENDPRVYATRLIDPATFTPVPSAALPLPLLVADAHRVDKKFTPAVTIDYQVTPHVFSYVTYSQGFKSGGFSGRIGFPHAVPPSFDPETVKNYEGGLKIDALNHKIRWNSAAFYVDYNNLQLTIFNQVEPITQNAGKATIKGLESELVVLPTSRLNLSLAAGYTDAKYDRIDPTTLIPNGAKIAYTPKWTVSGSASYELAVGEWSIKPQADAAYRSAVYLDALNTPALRQGGYILVNANLSVSDPSRLWRLSVGVTNLTDRRYKIGGFSDLPTTGFVDATYARPREWFVTARRSF